MTQAVKWLVVDRASHCTHPSAGIPVHASPKRWTVNLTGSVDFAAGHEPGLESCCRPSTNHFFPSFLSMSLFKVW